MINMTDQTAPSPHLLDIDSAVLAGHRLAEQLCCAMTRNGWSVSDFPDHPQGQEASRVLCEEFVGWLLKSDAEAAALPLEYRIQSLLEFPPILLMPVPYRYEKVVLARATLHR